MFASKDSFLLFVFCFCFHKKAGELLKAGDQRERGRGAFPAITSNKKNNNNNSNGNKRLACNQLPKYENNIGSD